MNILALSSAIIVLIIAIINLSYMYKKSLWWCIGGFFIGFILIPVFWFKYKPAGMGKYVIAYYISLIPYLYLTA